MIDKKKKRKEKFTADECKDDRSTILGKVEADPEQDSKDLEERVFLLISNFITDSRAAP